MNKNAREKELLEEAYASLYEAKEAPDGKHYDSAGRLRSGDADSDGRGGPKFRSDPTYVNPNEDGEIKVGSFVTTHNGTVVYIDDVDTDRDGETVYMGNDDNGGDHVLYSDQIAVEDNETAKKIGKDALKLAGKAALGTAKLAGKAAGKAALEVAHFATDDKFRRKRRKVEDNELEDLIAAEDGEKFSLFDDKGRVKGGGPSGLAQLDYEDSKEDDKEEDAEDDDKEEEDDVDIKQGGGTSASEFEAEDKTAFG